MKQSLTNGKILLTQDQIPMFFPDAADMITSVLIWATVMLYSSPPLIFILYSMTLPLYIWTFANTGFSSAYTKFTTDLILTSKDTGKSEKVETTIDNRSIAGNDFSEFKLT